MKILSTFILPMKEKIMKTMEILFSTDSKKDFLNSKLNDKKAENIEKNVKKNVKKVEKYSVQNEIKGMYTDGDASEVHVDVDFDPMLPLMTQKVCIDSIYTYIYMYVYVYMYTYMSII
jgi:hypothetical protein